MSGAGAVPTDAGPPAPSIPVAARPAMHEDARSKRAFSFGGQQGS
jgi:hypothetical protein